MRLIISILLIFLIGCTAASNSDVDKAVDKCIQLCQNKRAAGEDLSHGPCLSDRLIEDWVCDIAHNPRQEVDNVPSNQCPSFGTETHHFVELNPQCNFIRYY